MSTKIVDYPNHPTKWIEPFALQHMMVALELGPADKAILDYLDFFTDGIPVNSIHFSHVLPNVDLYSPYLQEGEYSLDNLELNSEVIDKMHNELKLRPLRNQTADFSFEVRKGNPLEELLKDANETPTNLLVIGQKNEGGEHRILARNLARKVKDNALIVPQNSKARLNKILVPIDFSNHSIKALRTAVALREQLSKVEIVAIHVYQMPDLSVYKVQKTYEKLKEMVESDRTEAFKHFIREHLPGYENVIDCQLVEQEGPGIARYILQSAKTENADLIVIGAKGHSKVERLLLGSVTEKLCTLNDAMPTLIVRR